MKNVKRKLKSKTIYSVPQGFPIHTTFKEFLLRYRCLVRKTKLPADPVQAVRTILSMKNFPTTEWQIGKTKVRISNYFFICM